jgi:hypothetical protein
MRSGQFISLPVALFWIALSSSPCVSDASPQAPTPAQPEITSSSQAVGITEEMIGRRFPPMSLTKHAESAEYGYSEKYPIAVGGGFPDGGHKVYGYLNALAGPEGQKVHYTRIGTCCFFKAPDSPFDGNGLLEVYEVTYDGQSKPSRLYFNWYGPPDPLIPVGLTTTQQHSGELRPTLPLERTANAAAQWR